MGNKILVSVFDNEPTAFEGLRALRDLHREGDITVYASTLIVKDRTGAVAIRQTAEKGPIGTLVGILSGAIVGLIGGPAGAAVGASVGVFGGITYDLFRAGVGVDFVEEVGAVLTSGKAAVIADVDETWVTPVDTRMLALGATTFRRLPSDVVDAQLTRESIAAEVELRELQAELRESSDEAKVGLRKSIQSQQRKLAATSDRIEKTLAEGDDDFQARLTTLREQQGKARDRQRARIDARIEELTASHDVRKAKLEDSHRLAGQWVEATREALVF